MDEELKKAAYLGLNLVDFEDHFPQEYATMQEVTTTTVTFPSTSRDVLTEILREGAQQMLTTAIEAEVAEWIECICPVNSWGLPGRSRWAPVGHSGRAHERTRPSVTGLVEVAGTISPGPGAARGAECGVGDDAAWPGRLAFRGGPIDSRDVHRSSDPASPCA